MNSLLALVAASAVLTACGSSDTNSCTLYRSSMKEPTKRLHVASFDAAEGRDYNTENCRKAQDLYQRQSGDSRFWCEEGRFKK
ncbi:MAG: hypothetical protein ACOYNZ_02160 [Rhodoferax sp.]